MQNCTFPISGSISPNQGTAEPTMTYYLRAFLVCLVLGQNVDCDINVSDPLFQKLPPIFHIDDDSPCGTYCKASILIGPEDPKSSHWQLIEDTIKHPKFYNHNELFHAICMEKSCPRRSRMDLRSDIADCYRNKYGALGLQFSVTELNCAAAQYSAGAFDKIALLCSIAYLLLIAAATYKHYKGANSKAVTAEQPVLHSFSVIANWRKLCTPNNRPDFQKLKFIQGIRFYNMLLVIFCHTQCSYLGGYVANTDYFEQVHRNGIRLFFATLSVFLVQTFFLISAFLLSFHVCQSMTVYKQSKWKYVCITFLNRYLRILPPLSVMIMMASTTWIIANFPGPLRTEHSNREFERCRENWWVNLMLINNHYNANEMCYFITWYLAADTQLYLVSLLILLIVWKFPHQRKLVLTAAISIGVLIPALVCYKYGLDFIYRLTPENTKRDNYRSFQFSAIYTSTYTNTASYMVGLALGCFYFALEKGGKPKKYLSSKWTRLLSALSVAVVLIASQDYSRPISIVLAGLVKPCYAFGVGMGILAMSQRANCLIKTVCEWKPVIFLGNFTYSTYVVQFGLVFFRTSAARKPLFVSDYLLLTSFVQDALLSIFCGFLMHILVEMPALQLQKMYIPQIRPVRYPKRCKEENK